MSKIMNKEEVKQLALAVYNKQVPSNFSFEDMEGSLRDQFRALAPDYNSYRRNALDIFEIIQSVIDQVLPNRIRSVIGMFADVKEVAQGQRARFTLKRGKGNMRRFITRVALGGVYERVRLDTDYIDVAAYAMGGSVYIEFEQFLDGSMDFAELTDLIIYYTEDEIYRAVYNALVGTFSALPAANKYTGNAFSATDMKRLITTARAYGGNATIFATPEFAASILPDVSYASITDKEDLRNLGYVGRYYGCPVIILPQSFENEQNLVKVFNPQYAFIIPTGGSADEKIVKVVFEGQSVINEVQNADQSKEFSVYKKFGTAVLNTNYYCIIQNTSLT